MREFPNSSDWKGYAQFCDEVERPAAAPPLSRYAAIAPSGMIGVRSLTEDETMRQNDLFRQHGEPFRYVPLDELDESEVRRFEAHGARPRQRPPRVMEPSGLLLIAVLGISSLSVLGAVLYVAYLILD